MQVVHVYLVQQREKKGLTDVYVGLHDHASC